MKRTIASLLSATLVAGAALAHSFTAGPLTIGHPWMRPTAAGAPNAAGYLSIHNAGQAPDRLIQVSTSSALKVEIHQSAMAGGMMRMRLLAGGGSKSRRAGPWPSHPAAIT